MGLESPPASAPRDREARAAGEQLAKYEDWIREIERRQADIAVNRPRYLRFLVGLLVASLLGFLVGTWFGVGTLVVGILMCAFGFYTVLFREGEYEQELVHLRNVAKGLRAKAKGGAEEG
jgi:hypothetical protein